MSRMVGTISRGVRAPIIRNGDDLAQIVTDSILEASKKEGYEIRNRDIVAMTEAIVARHIPARSGHPNGSFSSRSTPSAQRDILSL